MMNRKTLCCLALLAVLFAAVPTHAQNFTNVTGTITDPSGIPYANCNITAELVPSGLNPSINGAAIGGLNRASCDGKGSFSMTLGSNAVILPAATQWKFTVNEQPGVAPPLGTGPQSLSQTFTISGASQVLTFTTVPALSLGAAGASNAAPNMGFYLGNACQQANTNQCFFTTADLQQFNDGSWTNASTTITFASPHFGPGQALVNPLGMSVMGFQTCAADMTSAHASGGEIAPNAVPPTVIGFTATTLTISAIPVNSQALHTTFPVGGCVTVAHIDDAAAALMWTALNASAQCQRAFLQAANYFVTKPPQFLWDNPLACQNIGPELGGPAGNPGLGTTTLPAGYEVEGRGTGATAIYLSTNFPNLDPCNHKPTPSVALTPFQNGGACFVIPVMGGWKDFRIDGGGQGAPTALSGKTLGPYMAVGKLVDFTEVNYGGYTGGNSAGIELSFNNWLERVNNSGVGSIGMVVDSGAANNVGLQVVIESSSVDAVLINGPTASNSIAYSLSLFGSTLALANSQPFGAFSALSNFGGSIFLSGGYIYPNNGNEGANTNNGGIGYQCGTAGGILYAQGVKIAFGSGGGSNTQTAVKTTAACTNYFLNDFLGSQSAGFDIQDAAGSKEIDEGGNTVTPRMSIAGTVVNSPSVAITPAVAGNFVPSANFGTGAAVSAVTGNATNFTFTLTNGSAAVGANPTIAFTFPTPAFWQTPVRCSLWQVGGTQAITALTTYLAPSAQSATGVTFTYNGTPTVSLTELYQGTCTN